MSKNSDTAQVYNALREERRERRARLGVKCPQCIRKTPRRAATILLPGQRCFCGYRDLRPDDREAS